jgi:hypothetical protein
MSNEHDIVTRSKGGLYTKFETKYHSFSSYVFYFVPLLLRFKNICSFLFCACNDIKNVQFGSKMRENLKMFSDKISFGDRLVYPSCN